MTDTEKFIEEHNLRQSNINAIANAVKSDYVPKFGNTELTDGSMQNIGKTTGSNGRDIFTVSKDNKNIMTFATKKQLLDYLVE